MVLRNAPRTAALAALAAVVAAALAGASAAGARPHLLAAADEDTVAIRDGKGFAVVTGRSALLGTVARGLLIVTERAGSRCADLVVHGEEWRRTSSLRRMYGGRNLRFRVVSRGCRVGIAGRDIHLSAVVRGYASVKGDAGVVAVQGGSWTALPDDWRTERLGQPPPAVAPPTLRSLVRLEIRWLREIGMSWPRIKRTAAWRRFQSLG